VGKPAGRRETGEEAAETPAPAKGDRDVVSRQALANLFGVDVRTIANLVSEGMPKLARGLFSLSACLPWYIDREREAARAGKGLNDLDLARQRMTNANARKAERELAQAEGLLIPADLHERRLRERLDSVAGALKANSRYHAQVKAATTDEAADALLEKMADEQLAELYALNDKID
jgi:phage terminase Nu1 subunit (DNA packaging protein)